MKQSPLLKKKSKKGTVSLNRMKIIELPDAESLMAQKLSELMSFDLR
jgi:hypothetical protein